MQTIDTALRQPEFGFGEALNVIGVPASTLKTWHARGLVPLPLKPVSSGHRRRYSARDLITLYLQRLVLPYLGQRQAPLVAADCARILVEHYWPRTNDGQFPCRFLVVSRRQQDYGVDLVDAGRLAAFFGDTALTARDYAVLLASVPADRRAEVERDLERRTLVDPEIRLVLDARAILVRVLANIQNVREAKNQRTRRK